MPERLHVAGLFRLAAVLCALAGIALIVVAGARGQVALGGFGLFCAAMAGLDGLYRGRFGFRQLAILLGWFAVGIGMWALATAALMRMLEMRVAPELRTLFVLAASCAAGAAVGALLSITLRSRVGDALKTRLVGFGKGAGSAVSRRDAPRGGPSSGAARSKRPAGPGLGG